MKARILASVGQRLRSSLRSFVPDSFFLMDENKIGKGRQEISLWISPHKENPTSGGLVGLKRFIGPAVRGALGVPSDKVLTVGRGEGSIWRRA